MDNKFIGRRSAFAHLFREEKIPPHGHMELYTLPEVLYRTNYEAYWTYVKRTFQSYKLDVAKIYGFMHLLHEPVFKISDENGDEVLLRKDFENMFQEHNNLKPIYRFLASRKNDYSKPEQFTQDLAQVKYFILLADALNAITHWNENQ